MQAAIDPTKITGLFGGTFDPVHNGHVNIVTEVLARTAVEQIILMPAATPPHKLGASISPGSDRTAMLHLAFDTQPGVIISELELNRNGISYTCDTAALLQAQLEQQLHLIVGMDSLCELPTWKESGPLVRDYKFVICRRPGVAPPSAEDVARHFGADAATELTAAIIEAPEIDASSSELRAMLQCRDKAASRFLPAPVCDYISAHELYR